MNPRQRKTPVRLEEAMDRHINKYASPLCVFGPAATHRLQRCAQSSAYDAQYTIIGRDSGGGASHSRPSRCPSRWCRGPPDPGRGLALALGAIPWTHVLQLCIYVHKYK
jgi:hypothetical protein